MNLRFEDPNQMIEAAGRSMTVAELRKCCSVIEPGIVRVNETPHSNATTFAVLVETARQLGEPFGRYVVINDLTDAKTRPKGDHLDAILKALSEVGEHWAVVQPGSSFLRVVARFVLARMSRAASGRTSVHENLADALVTARKILSAKAAAE